MPLRKVFLPFHSSQCQQSVLTERWRQLENQADPSESGSCSYGDALCTPIARKIRYSNLPGSTHSPILTPYVVVVFSPWFLLSEWLEKWALCFAGATAGFSSYHARLWIKIMRPNKVLTSLVHNREKRKHRHTFFKWIVTFGIILFVFIFQLYLTFIQYYFILVSGVQHGG